MKTKYCPTCKEEKLLTTDFWYVSKGVTAWRCKECAKRWRREQRILEGQRAKVSPENKYCSGCGITKTAADFPKNKTEKDGLHERCRECCAKIFSRHYHGQTPHKDNIAIRDAKPLIHIGDYKRGYVYLFKLNEYYKIGISVNPTRRLTSINSETPYTAILIHQIHTDHMRRLEDELHQRFGVRRFKNEWFLLTDEDVQFILNIVEHFYEPS